MDSVTFSKLLNMAEILISFITKLSQLVSGVGVLRGRVGECRLRTVCQLKTAGQS
jgi:hypothetical protein